MSVWYTAPTAIRMLMKAGPEVARRYDLRRGCASSPASASRSTRKRCGGARKCSGLPIHDNWWQTETGGIMIANTPAFDIKPGSMGRPLPGIDACHRAAGRAGRHPRRSTTPEVEGELALQRGWPSMFRGYLNNEERYRKCFAGDLVPDRRPCQAGRRRLLLVRRPRRRRDQVRRPPDRSVRGGKRADGASGGGGGRRHRQAGRDRRRNGQGLRLAESRLRGRRRAAPWNCSGHARKRLGAAVAPKEIEFRRDLPKHAQRQDHAPPAEGARTRPAGRRPLDAGGASHDRQRGGHGHRA